MISSPTTPSIIHLGYQICIGGDTLVLFTQKAEYADALVTKVHELTSSVKDRGKSKITNHQYYLHPSLNKIFKTFISIHIPVDSVRKGSFDNLYQDLPVFQISGQAFYIGELVDEQSIVWMDQNAFASQNDHIYRSVEEPPTFPGCENQDNNLPEHNRCTAKKLNQFIHQNLVYPVSAKARRIQGIVVVSFVVEKDGSISQPTVELPRHPLLDQEALRLIQSLDELPHRWSPGKHRGKSVRFRYELPVRFTLYR